MIIQLIPAYTELWDVSAGPDGEVVFTKVVCIALAEHDSGQRLVCPMVPGEHINMASGQPAHVGYATSSEWTEAWDKQCQERRKQLNKLEADAAAKKGPQIIVPDKKLVTAKELVH